MAGYAFRTFDERKQTENLWEAGAPAKEVADKLNISIRNCAGGRMAPDFPTSAAVMTLTWPNLGYSKALNGEDARQRKEQSEHEQL